jgi:phage virion morphogenesis protein
MATGADLDAIEPFLHELMDGLQPGPRKRLVEKILRLARRANAQRIAANIGPDGTAMAPRKHVRPGQRKKMFKRIGKQNSLRIRATPDEGELRFVNGLVEETAAVHHFGLEGFVGRTRQGRAIRTKYQARTLLGFGREQQEFLDEALKHLAR